MTFQSVLYLLFLAGVVLATLPLRGPRSRQILLLAASLCFYATQGVVSCLALFWIAIFNLSWGRVLRRRPTAALLWVGVGADILTLLFFNDLVQRALFGGVGIAQSIMVPIGISFYTFQGISYLVDVYRGAEETRPTFLEFLLYVAFWPTVLSGPVCRVHELVPQFRAARRIGIEDIRTGTRRILCGLFMKVVVADTLARGIGFSEGVQTGFDSLSGGWGAIDVWFLAIGFGLQLYFDFAGYSHIAIGSARLLGIELRENFDHPYFSSSPSEFWTRWHMSMSSWIRDYVFFPLATARRGLIWRNLSLLVTMALFGLWHGIGWTFLLWGTYHGVLLVGHRVLQQSRVLEPLASRTPRPLFAVLSWAVTFGLVALGWILFRANDLSQAVTMLSTLVSPAAYGKLSLRLNYYVAVAVTGSVYASIWALGRILSRRPSRPLERVVWFASPVYYAALILAIIIWSNQASTFVYFQF